MVFFTGMASTTTALIRLTDTGCKCVNDNSLFGLAVASFDMSRAFDTLEGSLAISKMRELGFPSGFLRWLHNFFK